MNFSRFRFISTVGRWLAWGALLFVPACSDADANDDQETPGAACPVVVSDTDCDKTQRPIVFIHGTFGSGDNIENVAALFGSNGFCQDRFVAIDYHSLTGDLVDPVQRTDKLIDKVLADTGLDKVELMGHSQGTRHAIEYLKDAGRAAKVAHYIHFSGGGEVPNDIPTLSLSSENDLGGTTHHATGDNVQQVTLKEEDHFAVASSLNSFIEVYKYLRGAEPKYKEVQCGDELVTVEGIAETFVDNRPVLGHAEIYELGSAPRVPGRLVVSNSNATNGDGHFGPVQLKRNVAYELKGFDEQGKLIGYQYFSPFKRSNRLARLLTPSGLSDIASLTTGKLVRTPEQMAVVIRYAAGAFRADLGDSLKVDGKEVLTTENAGKASSTVGLFLSDVNSNGQSELGAPSRIPFVVITDAFIDAKTAKFVELDFNGNKTRISNWPASDAYVSVFFQ